MKIIISPAKKMKTVRDFTGDLTVPLYLHKAQVLVDYLKSLSPKERKILWGCSEKIAEENNKRINDMDLGAGLTPALLSYDGIQYDYMAPAVFEDGEYEYISDTLRILSGLYGVLRPFDGIVPYRLEMQAKTDLWGYKDLYDYWGSEIYDEVRDDDGIIINLASKEYSRTVERYLKKDDLFITCVFGDLADGAVVQKGVYVKMARGEMVRFMASSHITTAEELKTFSLSGYAFDEKRSSEKELVFICRDPEKRSNKNE